MRSRRFVITMQPNRTDDAFFPLIPHIAPIWPPDKRIEYVKARKAAFRRFVRQKMILFKFLQSINPGMNDLLPEMVDNGDDADSIVNLTKDFQEERRKKRERIIEIQTEAHYRAERKKTAWGKSRSEESKSKLPRKSLTVAGKWNLNSSTSQSSPRDFQLSEGHQKILKIEGNTSMIFQRETAQLLKRTKTDQAVFPRKNGGIYSPQIYTCNKYVKRPGSDPRFQRLLTCLVPPERERELDYVGSNSREEREGRENISQNGVQGRERGKTLHEKWLATMTPQYFEKNVSPEQH